MPLSCMDIVTEKSVSMFSQQTQSKETKIETKKLKKYSRSPISAHFAILRTFVFWGLFKN